MTAYIIKERDFGCIFCGQHKTRKGIDFHFADPVNIKAQSLKVEYFTTLQEAQEVRKNMDSSAYIESVNF